MARLARLDSVRTVAILSSIALHHGFLDGCSSWIGVDLFFVLSGYLITGTLLRSREKPNYWSRFYVKRALRIGPPLVIVLLMVSLFTHGAHTLALLGYGLFLGNVLDVTRYSVPDLIPLWSLAVEGHFYLLWPLAIMRLSRRSLLLTAASVLAIEPVLRFLFSPHTHFFFVIYSLTPFRLDSLAAGGMLAIVMQRTSNPDRLRRMTAFAGVAFFLTYVTGHLLDPTFGLNHGNRLFDAIGYSIASGMCLCFVAQVLLLKEGFLNRVLSCAPISFIGRISYGMYLYHMVVLDVLAHALHIPLHPVDAAKVHRLFPLSLGITMLLATASYYSIEEPLRAWGARVIRRMESGPTEKQSGLGLLPQAAAEGAF